MSRGEEQKPRRQRQTDIREKKCKKPLDRQLNRWYNGDSQEGYEIGRCGDERVWTSGAHGQTFPLPERSEKTSKFPLDNSPKMCYT
jgi:hypothetical protein